MTPLSICSATLKSLWQKNQLPGKTFANVGVALDPNKALPVPNYRRQRAQFTKFAVAATDVPMKEAPVRPSKPNPIVEQLEELSKQRAESKFRLVLGLAQINGWITNS